MEVIQDYNDIEQTRKVIKENLQEFTDSGYKTLRDNDIKNYMQYYGFYDRSKFDHIRKFNERELPALPRKINLQQNAVNILLSERALRPIPGAPRIYDRQVSIDRFNNVIKQKINILLQANRAKYYKFTADIESIKMKMQEIESQMQREPESAEDAERIKQLATNMPYVKNQFFQIMDSIKDQQLLSEKEIEKHERYFKYDYRDYYQKIAEKIKRKILKETKFKDIDNKAFKSKMITGKPIFLVISEENKNNVTIRNLNENTVFWPKFSGIKWIQKGPWVGYSEIISFQSMMNHYGVMIEESYGEEAIKSLKAKNKYNHPETLMVSTSDGGAYFIEQLNAGNSQNIQETYSGSFQTSYGIEKKTIYYKASRKVYIKVSPNKYNKDKPFEHYVNPFKRLINKDEYTYKPKEGVYVHKKDNLRILKKENVEVFSKKKGEDYIVKYITDVYCGVILDNRYIVGERLHDRVVENPDDYGDVNLPILGRAFSDETEQPTSPIIMTNDLQDLYDTLSLHREIAIAISGAAGVVIDRSQRPDGMEEDEWEYHMKMGRLYIQTADAEGNPKASNFNQWKTYDNSIGQGVLYIDQIMAGIQDLMGLIIGVPRQRIGEVTKADQVGTYDASLKQASLVTQIQHHDIDELESHVLEEAINLYIKYHLEDDEGILDLHDDIGFDQVAIETDELKKYYFKVYLDSNESDSQKIDMIKEYAMQSALSGKGILDMGDVAKLFNKDSLRDLMDTYDNIVDKKRSASQEAAQQQIEQQSQKDKEKEQLKGQIQQQLEQVKNELERKKLQWDEYKHKSEMELRNKEITLDSQLRLLELINEQKSEEEVILNNDKHATADEQIRLLQTKIDALLQTRKMDDDFEINTKKELFGDSKGKSNNRATRKIVKEHASDR
jgi:hypothetical protein